MHITDITHSFCYSVSNIIYKDTLHLKHKCSSDILCFTDTHCLAVTSAQVSCLSFNSQFTMKCTKPTERGSHPRDQLQHTKVTMAIHLTLVLLLHIYPSGDMLSSLMQRDPVWGPATSFDKTLQLCLNHSLHIIFPSS